MTAIARFSVVALDCPDAPALAAFYSRLTGWPARRSFDDDDWIQLDPPDGQGAAIACQQVPEHRPPQWPGAEHPQQVHLDFDVPDLDAAEEQVLAAGARKHEVQPGTTFRVFLDPAGHPFCLVLETGSSPGTEDGA